MNALILPVAEIIYARDPVAATAALKATAVVFGPVFVAVAVINRSAAALAFELFAYYVLWHVTESFLARRPQPFTERPASSRPVYLPRDFRAETLESFG